MIALALLLGAALASEPALKTAAEAELTRAMAELRLPDQPPPHFIAIEALDGQVVTAEAELGALMSLDVNPHRMLRVEVRVGTPELDSGNFEAGFGAREGTVSRMLPVEDVEIALRREIWLSLDEAYKGATELYANKRAARQGTDRERLPDLAPATPLLSPPVPPASVDGEAIRRVVEELSGVLRAFPTLETGEAVARDWQGARMLVTSEGTRAWLPTGHTVVRVEATGRLPDGSRVVNARSWVVRDPADLPPLEEMKASVDTMATWLVGLQSAPVEDDYLGPVLFEHAAAVELFRQLLAPEIAGTPPMERAPDDFGAAPEDPPTSRIGRRLLPDGWTVTDDPLALPDAPGAGTHDMEGVPAQPVVLVEDGVVRDVLMSRTPRKDRPNSNGHGRSLGTDRREGLPAVVFVEPRRAASERRLERKALKLARQAGLPYVIVVGRLTPPALTAEFEIAFSGDRPLAGLTPPYEAWRLYPDGRREPVRGLSFSGVDRRVLRDIALAGKTGASVGELDTRPDRSRFAIGPVGGLPVTWVVPPVLITELELRGSAGGEPRILPRP